MRKRNQAPNNYGVLKRSENKEHIIIENCINAYVDVGNKVQGIWDYLNRLIGCGDITEPYAKQVCCETLDIVKSVERYYRNVI